MIPPTTRRQLAVLGLILAIGAGVRFYHIGAPSLWMDEIWSIEMAMGRGSLHDRLPANVIHYDQVELTDLNMAGPWWKICTHLGGVTHPPLYFIVLRGWMDLFGTGAAAVRSLSAIFSLATLLILFDLCRWLHGPKIALFAAAIFALAAGQLDFAQEARSYPMLIFLGLCCADLVIRVEFFGASAGRLILLAVFITATALTHYLCAGALLGLAVYAALRLRGRARQQVAGAFVAGALLALAAWIPLFITQKHTLPSLAPTFLREAHADQHLKLTLYRIIGLPTEFLLGESRGEALTSGLVLTIFLFTVVLPVVRLFRRRPGAPGLFWVLWIFGTLGFVAAMDLARQTTLLGYPRYTILASPAIYVVIAAFDWPRRTFVRDALAIACIALLAIVAIQRCIDGVPAREDWRQLADLIQNQSIPGEPLVFFGPDPWVPPGVFYMNYRYYTLDSAHPWMALNRPAGLPALSQLDLRQTLWLIGKFFPVDGRIVLPGWETTTAIQTNAWTACHMRQVVPSTELRSR